MKIAITLLFSLSALAQSYPGALPNCTATRTANCSVKAGTDGTVNVGIPVPGQNSVQAVGSKLSESISILDYGAKMDARSTQDFSCTSGSPIITSATATFVSGDVGKVVSVRGCGASGAIFHSTVLSISDATRLVAADNAGSTASATTGLIATDDAPALQAAVTKVIAAGNANQVQFSPAATILIPRGTTYLGSTVTTCPAPCTNGTSNVGITFAGVNRAASVILSDFNGDVIQLFTSTAGSGVRDLYIGNSNTSGSAVAIRVRGNGQRIDRNWLLATQGIVVETTSNVASSAVQIADNVCDSGGIGGPACIKTVRTSGADPSPNSLLISNTTVYSNSSGIDIENGWDITLVNTQCINMPASAECVVTKSGTDRINLVNTTVSCGSASGTYGLDIASGTNAVNSSVTSCAGNKVGGLSVVGVPSVVNGALTVTSAADVHVALSTTGNSHNAYLDMSPTDTGGASAASGIQSTYTNGGVIFTLPRDVGTHGYHFRNHAGTELLFLDSTNPLKSTTGTRYLCVDTSGKVTASASACSGT